MMEESEFPEGVTFDQKQLAGMIQAVMDKMAVTEGDSQKMAFLQERLRFFESKVQREPRRKPVKTRFVPFVPSYGNKKGGGTSHRKKTM